MIFKNGIGIKGFEVLSYILLKGGSVKTQLDISRNLNSIHSHITRCVNELIRIELVTKEKYGRSTRVSLTDKGNLVAKKWVDINLTINKKYMGFKR